jgi:hypothetical protein
LIEHRLKRVLLGLLRDRASVPRLMLDQNPDPLSHPFA